MARRGSGAVLNVGSLFSYATGPTGRSFLDDPRALTLSPHGPRGYRP